MYNSHIPSSKNREMPWRSAFNEYSKSMFSWRSKENTNTFSLSGAMIQVVLWLLCFLIFLNRYAMKCLDKKRIKMKGGETLALNERIMLSLVSTGVSGIFSSPYFSVRPSSVRLSVMLSPPKPQGRIQPNLLHHFPSWLGCYENNIIFPSVRRPSICLSGYLLNHWAQFNQTCYMTSPHG